jgi:hypothetical protein
MSFAKFTHATFKPLAYVHGVGAPLPLELPELVELEPELEVSSPPDEEEDEDDEDEDEDEDEADAVVASFAPPVLPLDPLLAPPVPAAVLVVDPELVAEVLASLVSPASHAAMSASAPTTVKGDARSRRTASTRAPEGRARSRMIIRIVLARRVRVSTMSGETRPRQNPPRGPQRP